MNKKIISGLAAFLLASVACAGDKDVSVTAKASYKDETSIAYKVKSECVDLGAQFSQATKKYLENSGWQVSLAEEAGVKTGKTLKLEITNVYSAGNAFIGHRKSVSVLATLYKDGKLVDKFVGSRGSGGGVFAGFKGSCSVLNRCVDTLGGDIAQWMSAK